MTRVSICSVVVLGLSIVTFAAAPQQAPPRSAQEPAFRSSVIAVPVDVRVVDKSGKPITDLRREDFSVTEDGVAQTIVHFAASTLAALEPRTNLRARLDAPPSAGVLATAHQDYRIFLIVLGTRGFGDAKRHPETLNALLDFVRHRLLPQDQVALLTLTRGCDFTADHEKVARLLESVAGLSGGRDATAQTPNPAMAASDAELGFADYVGSRGDEPQDELESVLFGINYLRLMEGEKHLVYVSERGFLSPAWDDFNRIWNFREIENWDAMKRLTRAANDARVALNTIVTGQRVIDIAIPRDTPVAQYAGPVLGASAVEIGNGQITTAAGDTSGLHSPLPSERVFAGLSSLEGNVGLLVDYDLKQTALRTGGLSSMYADTAKILGRIDAATRTHYLLAYYPSNSTADGHVHTIGVTVNRPGATVMFRRSYTARASEAPVDRRRVMADSRIGAAGRRSQAISDLDVAAAPSFARAAGGNGEVVVPISVDAAHLTWGEASDGRHTAHLEVAVYCGNSAKILTETRRQWNIALTDETYALMLHGRFAREIRIPVTTKPEYVKVIVYDSDADRLGSTLAKVK